MTRVLTVWGLVGALACGGAVEQGQPPADELEVEVVSFLESYLAAIETRDESALRGLYVDDGRFEWIEDGEVRYRSVEDVLDGLARLPADATIRTDYEDRVVSLVGATGATVSTRFRTVIGEGAGAFGFGGMMTMVLERRSDGWRLVSGHTSSSRQNGR